MSAARDRMVSLTDWLHERQARAWWRPLDLGEIVSASRPIPRTARGKTAPSPFQAAPKKAPAGPERVELSPGARSALAEQLALTADGTETGGALIGYLSSDDGSTLVVEDASGPGTYADRTSVRLEMQIYPWEDLERCYVENGWAGRLVGDWHTHDRGDGSPSAEDKRGAANLAQRAGAPG